MFSKLLIVVPLAAGFLIADDFLDLGSIHGDARATGYEKQIEITGFSYDADVLLKGDGFNRIELFKRFDSASPELLQAAVKGTHLPLAILTLTRPFNDTLVAFAKVTLKDVVVVKLHLNHGGEGEPPTEDLTLQFGSAEWCQRTQDAKGGNGPYDCALITAK